MQKLLQLINFFIVKSGRVVIGLSAFFCVDAVYSQPNWLWGKDIHTTATEYSKDIVVDKRNDDLIIVGEYNLSLSAYFGNSFTGASKGGFVAKYSSAGTVIWGFKIGDNLNNKCNGVAVDSLGNIYVAGSFEGTTDFKGLSATPVNLTSLGSSDAFLAKYNSLGQLIWVKRGGGTSDDQSNSVSLSSTKIFVTGTYKGNANFGGYSTVVANSSQNIFITCYDYNGTTLWLADAGSNQDSFGNDVFADNSGVYISGDFKGSFLSVYNYAGTNSLNLTNTNSSKSDAYILALTNTGSVKWGVKIGSNEDEKCYSITGSGNLLYISGSLRQNTYFPSYSGNPVPFSGGVMDMYVAGLSKTNGATQWVRRETSAEENEALSVETDVLGNVYASGYYKTSLSFAGGTTLNSAGGFSEDVFVASYSNSGSFQWALRSGDNGRDVPYGLACNSGNEIYVCGEYKKSPVFGPSTLTNDSGPNIFIAKIGCAEILTNSITASQSVCKNSIPSPLNGSMPAGGNPPFTYKWEQSLDTINWSAASGINNLQNYSPGALSTSTYFRRKVFSSTSCYNINISNFIKISIDQLPSIAIAGPDQTRCISSSSSAVINANIPTVGIGQWIKVSGGASFSSASSPTTTLTGLTPGDNIFCWNISNGSCPSSTDTVKIHVDALPTVSNAGPNKNVCSSSPVLSMNANVPVNGTGIWTLVSGTGNINSINSPTTVISNIGLGDNIFLWTINNGICPSSSSTITVHADVPPDSAYAGNDIITDIPFVHLAANLPSIGTGHWSVLSGSGTFSSASDGNASISGLVVGSNVLQWELTNGGCPSKKDQVIVTLNPLQIPNGFSPNSDGKNDTFKVRGLEYYPDVKFKVFNKWGNIVYSSNEYKNEWEGKNNDGQLLVDDTYYFTLEVMPKMEYSGFIIIKTN
jgi:gliding motility-associated-like protein